MKMFHARHMIGLTVVLIMAGCAPIAPPGPSAPADSSLLTIEQQGISFIGGENNGRHVVGQSAVHFLAPPAAKLPAVMVPGKGLSAWIYTNTPSLG